jgi:hypothetical protein
MSLRSFGAALGKAVMLEQHPLTVAKLASYTTAKGSSPLLPVTCML